MTIEFIDHENMFFTDVKTLERIKNKSVVTPQRREAKKGFCLFC